MSVYPRATAGYNHPLGNRPHAHRLIVFTLVGPGTQHCHWCQRPLEWKAEKRSDQVEVDHLDDNPQNNDPSNLVVSCHRCNVGRGARAKLTGRKLTPEHRAALRKPKGTGRRAQPRQPRKKRTPEHQAKLTAAIKAYWAEHPREKRDLSPEERARLATMKGRKHSPEARTKMSTARKGKKYTAEHRAAISAGLMGHPVSAEARAKMSASHKARRAKPSDSVS